MFIVSLILFQAIIFIGLVFVLRRIMTKNVVSATSHIEKMSQDYDRKEQDLNQQLQEVRQKSEEIMKNAQDQAQALKTGVIKEAEGERDRILKQSRLQGEEIIKQADKSRQLLLSEIEERIAREAVDKACELIECTLPEELKRDVHVRWAKELIENGFSELKRLRLPEDIEEVKIASAFALSEEERKALLKKLKDTLGLDLRLKEEVEPKIVAGLIITIGSLVLDGSLKNKIRGIVKDA